MVAFGHVDFEQVGRTKLRDEGRRKRKREGGAVFYPRLHRGENGGGRGPKGRWKHGRAPESSRPLIIKPHLPPRQSG